MTRLHHWSLAVLLAVRLPLCPARADAPSAPPPEVASATAIAAQPGDISAPDALTLLKRALAAHRALGPATVVTRMEGSFEDEPMTITLTSRRNSDTRFTVSASARLGRITLEDGIWQWYKADAREVFYDGTENIYYRHFRAAPLPADPMREFLTAPGLVALGPSSGGAGASVTAVEHEGRPAWEVVSVADPRASRMIFDREDHLIRMFRFTDEGGAFDVRVDYTLAPGPFPESTFQFSPPARAREVKPAPPPTPVKAPAPKPPARKAPPSRLPRR